MSNPAYIPTPQCVICDSSLSTHQSNTSTSIRIAKLYRNLQSSSTATIDNLKREVIDTKISVSSAAAQRSTLEYTIKDLQSKLKKGAWYRERDDWSALVTSLQEQRKLDLKEINRLEAMLNGEVAAVPDADEEGEEGRPSSSSFSSSSAASDEGVAERLNSIIQQLKIELSMKDKEADTLKNENTALRNTNNFFGYGHNNNGNNESNNYAAANYQSSGATTQQIHRARGLSTIPTAVLFTTIATLHFFTNGASELMNLILSNPLRRRKNSNVNVTKKNSEEICIV
jgi:hypothetical protein